MGIFSYIKNKFSHGNEVSKDQKKSVLLYEKGLEKSRKNFADKLKKLANKYDKIDPNYFDELEEILIEADVGVSLTLRIVQSVIKGAEEKKLIYPKDINELLIDTMFVDYVKEGENIVNEINFVKDGPTVLLVVGVNGVGKTTTIAKLANRYLKQGKKIVLAAADTFRAGAVEQLTIWAEKLGVKIVTGPKESDPASVAYDGAKLAKNENADLLIIDTAGRLQTKNNLMAELAKISRVVSKEIPNAPHETFLVIDATTGQNGVIQAKAFNEVTKISGCVLTKMDGTSKGGILLAIRDELGIPVRFIGLGEKLDDLQEFDLDKYLYGLCLGE